MAHAILLFDGVCGFCNRLVRLILRHDREAIFRFASLQSPLAAGILERHGVNAADLETVFVVINHDEPGEFLLSRSDAILYVLQRLAGTWRAAALLFGLVPRPVRNRIYDIVARNRYRIFGRYNSCPLPDEQWRSRFLDV